MECAAQKGYPITGLTLSPSQQAFATQRFQGKPWEDLTTLKLQDYRDEKNKYNTIVSIEMFEAVGEAYWSKYFKTIKNCLSKDGKAFIQVIIIEDKVFEGYKKRGDFIQKHIFPGGMLPSLSIFKKRAQENHLQVKEVFSFGEDYAITLQKWFENVKAKEAEILSLGYSKEFLRKWYFYLAYCIAGFVSKRTDVVQIELEHAEWAN
jgi:cyclopropane-fatty-acyl-phospholipid synthase